MDKETIINMLYGYRDLIKEVMFSHGENRHFWAYNDLFRLDKNILDDVNRIKKAAESESPYTVTKVPCSKPEENR